MGLIHLIRSRFIVLMAIHFLNLILIAKVCAQTNPEKESGKSISRILLSFKDKNGISKPVTNKAQWDQKRLQILDSMQIVMGMLPDRTGLPKLDIQITDSLKRDNYIRLSISFKATENERVTAYLYIPANEKRHQKLPAMLVLHETDESGKKSVDGESHVPNRANAKELAQRGYIVIAPDYPSFGDSKDYNFDSDRYESGTMKGIFNHMRCIDVLQERADVDPERIGVIGHSLGGHNSLFVGAFDKRIKVVVSSCGWTLFDYYNVGEEVTRIYGGRLGPWAQKRYMPSFVKRYIQDGEKTPFDFDEIIAALAPRPFFSNSPLNDSNFDVKGVKKGVENASKVYHLFNAEGNLQVRYPVCGHDFPPAVRLEAYRFIDKILKNTPLIDKIE